MGAREILIAVAGSFSFISICLSSWLILQHQTNMTNFSVQSKIVGIIWMIPIYSVDSFLSLVFPSASLYIDMLRDCYEAYVLYLFLSLMLSYMDTDCREVVGGDEAKTTGYDSLISYLENKQSAPRLPLPFSLFYSGDLPKGQDFLRFCKFGTLQYCMFRPLTTLAAILLDRLGLYHEATFSTHSGWLYLTIMVNISIAFAFAALATFYTTLKKKLAPYEPVGKFLCIKFVIFFAFWQSVIIAIFVRVGMIHDIDGYTTHNLSRGLQDTLICFEMFLVSIAHLFTFSYKPFTDEGRRQKRTAAFKEWANVSLHGPLIPVTLAFAADGDRERNRDTNKNSVSAPYVPQRIGSSGRSSLTAMTRADGSEDSRRTTSKARSVMRDPHTSTPLSSNIDTARNNTSMNNPRSGMMGILDRNFASSAAVRDFNESMPVIVLPSNFTPEKGRVAVSRPSDRVTDADTE